MPPVDGAGLKMSTLLGLTASAASATHKHEFQRIGNDGAMNNNNQNPFISPLQYLHGRLQAFTTACTSAVAGQSEQHHEVEEERQQSQLPEASDGHVSDTSEATTEAASIRGTQGSIKHKKPRAKVPKTTYLLSHPAPKIRAPRIRARNRMLLQLRRVAESKSPVPILEVFPGYAFPRSISKRLSHATKQSGSVNNSDLVVLNCPIYTTGRQRAHEDDDDEEQVNLADRDVVGSIRFGEETDGAGEIVIGSSQWTASPFEKNRYEFKSTDDDGNEVIARWFLKNSSKKAQRAAGEVPVDRKFSFSVLRPDTRKHPVIGHIDQTKIHISDHYTIPASPTGSPIVGPSEGFSPLELGDGFSKSYFNQTYPPPNSTVETSDDLKRLILLTGIWVAIGEGWSEALTSHLEATATSNQGSTRMRSVSGRTCSWESKAETPVNGNSARARVASWSHRHSISSTSPISPVKTCFPRRSNTIGSGTGRRRAGTNEMPSSVENIAEDVQSQISEPTPIKEEVTEVQKKAIKTEQSRESLQAGTEVSDPTGGESVRGLKGMLKRTKKSEKRKSLLDIIQRKPKA